MLNSPQGPGNITSIPKFMLWREQNRVFEDMAAYDFGGPGINLSGSDRPEQVKGIHVSANYFRLFGASPAIGRTFTSDEDRPRGGHYVVISNGLWTRRYGSDPSLIGKIMLLGGEPYTVVSRGSLAAAPSRSQQHRPGALSPRCRPTQARRYARHGQDANEIGC
jgi:hypothetical protein